MIRPPAEGIVCLANDGIIDGLIALCESLRAASPNIPVTVIPFDRNVSRTREVTENFGYSLYEDRSLQAMDSLGNRYWPGETWRPHSMRKLCAFSGPYEHFLFLDADVVVLRPLEPYFEAFRASSADLMYFWTDLSMVYRGQLREEMVTVHGAVGFQTGVFMGRRGTLPKATLERVMTSCVARRHEFVDILEQTFLNYVVDVTGVQKLCARQALPHLVDAWAGMRLKRRGDGFVLADARTPESGRPVTLIHWGGYALGPFMPYRRIFLAYRLAEAGRVKRITYQAACIAKAARRLPRHPLRWLAYRWLTLGRKWLAARGYPAW